MADQLDKEVKGRSRRHSASKRTAPSKRTRSSTGRLESDSQLEGLGSYNTRSRRSTDLKRDRPSTSTEDTEVRKKVTPAKKIKSESDSPPDSEERALRSNKRASLLPGLPPKRRSRRSLSIEHVKKKKTSKRQARSKGKTGTCASSSSEERTRSSSAQVNSSKNFSSGRRTSVLTSSGRFGTGVTQNRSAEEDTRTQDTMADEQPTTAGESKSLGPGDDRTSNAASSASLTVVPGGAAGPSTSGLNSAAAAGPSSSFAFSLPLSDEDEADVGRLQALLEARGLPSHLFGSINSRMHHFLQRTMMSGNHNLAKAQQLVQGLEASGDEATQLSAVMELCQMLVMGNEETLSGFPVKQAVPALITLLKMEHNYEMMNHACRALCYMMDSLPRSSAIIVEAVPVLLEKLQSISCMDVAEQALSALETLSTRHSRSVMQAGGVNAVLTYIDFFSLAAQRSALAIAANCCLNATAAQWSAVRESLAALSARINPSHDQKCIESACYCFTRLVDNVQNEEKFLKELVAHSLLTNLQQLLSINPPILSTNTFVAVIRMLVVMCSNCPDLAVVILKQNMNETIQYLLVGSGDILVQRTPQEHYELVSLIAELMPTLPKDGIFAINETLSSKVGTTNIWQWCDDGGVWRPYSYEHCRLIDASEDGGEEEANLTINGESYTLDLLNMTQTNDDTGTTRSIQRAPKIIPKTQQSPKVDSRAEVLAENEELASSLIKSLFGVLYQIYSCSAGPQVRHKCVQAILRMVHFASPEILREVLSQHTVSSHVAAMLACNDSKVVVNAMQLAHCLMSKLPDVFGVYFVREGVMHQMLSLRKTSSTDLAVRRKKPQKRSPKRHSDQKVVSNSDDSKPTTRSRAAALHEKEKEKDKKKSGGKSFLQNLNPTRWGKSQQTIGSNKISKEVPPPSLSNRIDVGIKEKVRDWIRSEADIFLKSYFSEESGKNPALQIFNTLESATKRIFEDEEALIEIALLIHESDASAFEIVHSGLIEKLNEFLTGGDERLRKFLEAFVTKDENSNRNLPDCGKPDKLRSLVVRLLDCLHHLEQLEVKVHDMPRHASSRHTNAFRFLMTQQMKCQLKRHPMCRNLHQWHSGPVKIEALATASAIERYLTGRGYATLKENEEETDGENSDDSDDIGPIPVRGDVTPELEILINDTVIQPNMTIYQAIKQIKGDTDTDTENEQTVFSQTHVLFYRPASDRNSTSNTVPPTAKKSRKGSASAKKDRLWNEGVCPQRTRILDSIIKKKLNFSSWNDPCLSVAQLLRNVHSMCQHWYSLYSRSCSDGSLLQHSAFQSSKLTAKAKRQLLDPLVIMTGHLPNWLTQLVPQCPFLLPFDTRKLVFCLTTFDRERSLNRLQSTFSDPLTENSDRIGPRLDRKKKVVYRENLLADAEQIIEETAHMRAILEIQYSDEVGTGLGPTMEFFSLISRELQKTELNLWRSPEVVEDHIFAPQGLFPAPLARNAKTSVVNKVKSKFRFLGRLMAKCLMDSRLMDLHLSTVFYKWMLGLESSLGSEDLKYIDEDLARSFRHLENMNESLEKGENCEVEDLDLNFTLPGYPEVELKKGGKDTTVTACNLKEYLDLLAYWTLVEGVQRQMEAFRDGFESVFPLSNLRIFYPEELDCVFCGDRYAPWDYNMLLESSKTDHGYTHESQAVKFLFEILSSYSKDEQRNFLQFVTGSPRLPVGGFKALTPPLTIVRKTVVTPEKADDFLPSVMTCVNYLKLPEYSCREVMMEKLTIAANEGQLSFHLS